METIHIYHTNDIHSHFENWPRIEAFLKEKKKHHLNRGEEVFLFDVGDFVDRWHPLSEGTKGKANVALLNECGYTAVTIGNNEGVNLSHEDLDHLYGEAEFDILTANFYDGSSLNHPEWVKPFKVYCTKQGTRFAVIGLTAYFSHLFQLLGWHLTEPLAELKQQLHQIKEKADMIILLSHLGINSDEKMAEEFPEIDVILGGHTHHILQNGKLLNGTLLCAAGKYGNFVGHVSLEVSDQKTVLQKTAELFDVHHLPAASGENEVTAAFFQKGKEMLSQRISFLPEQLPSDFSRETKLSELLCEALREWCQTDCAFLNAGLLLGPLSGEVTNFHLLSVLPHPINPCKVELSGRELSRVLIQTKDDKWLEHKVAGLGFRGTVMGKFIYNQIDFKENNQVIEINGQEIDPFRKYSLAIPDMFTFGRFFHEIYYCEAKKYYLPEFLRDLLKWKLQKDI